MPFFNWYDLPPSACSRCGDQQYDLYCYGEIVFDDGDTVPVCDYCAQDWFRCYSLGPDGEDLVDPEKAAAFQRRGVDSYLDRSLRELRKLQAAERQEG